MSNPFKWYVYISVDGAPWCRYMDFGNSEMGRELAVQKAGKYNLLVGIESKVIRERREGGE